MKEKILLAASGGVDSTVSAFLLKEQGYDVHCAVCVMSPAHFAVAEAAKKACLELSLELEVLDMRERFGKCVVEPFCRAYCDGTTPSPCVFCNPLVKFASMCELADKLGIKKIATGHYAKIVKLDGGYAVAAADEAARDQSYMLYRLSQQQLERLVFPLADYTKQKIRQIAEQNNLSCHDAPDSEENCFIVGESYVEYLERLGYKGLDGNFFLPDGRTIPHLGTHRYTVGQRKGLGIGGTAPLYVREILENGDIQLCYAGGEYFSEVVVSSLAENPNFSLTEGESYSVKIRSAAKPVPCEIVSRNEDKITVRFSSPARAAAKGQSAVFYRDGFVAGGGVIEKAH